MDVTSYLLGKKNGGVTPTGTLNITENGTHDVTNYASANVDVPTGGEIVVTRIGAQYKPSYYQIFEKMPYVVLGSQYCKYLFSEYKGPVIPKLKSQVKITNMQAMFYNCSNVTSLDLSEIDASEVTNTTDMFRGCSALTQIDLSNFNTSNDTNTNYMFQNTSKLSMIDISNFDFTHIISSSYMFSGCGTNAKIENGAYAEGIPYVYVKDADAQAFVLSTSYIPSTWTTDNVVIKNR